MSNIKEIVEFYKEGHISKRSFEAELAREFNPFANISVVLDTTTTIGATNASYVAMLVPEYVNDIVKHTLVIDEATLMNKLTCADVDFIKNVTEKMAPAHAKMLSDFVAKNRGLETTYGECVMVYTKMYETFLNEIIKCPNIATLVQEKTIDLTKLHDVQLAIESGNESVKRAVEYINIHKVIPNFALVIAEDTFQQLNVAPNLADHIYYDINKPVENYWWTKLVSNTTGTFNPEGREDLCPMKDFINKRR